MTREELYTLINEKMTPNGKNLISAIDANLVCKAIVDSAAFKLSPLPNYSGTVANTDLDGSLQVIVTHSLNSWFPDITMWNELREEISTEYFTAEPINANNVRFTFYEAIPITDLAHYLFVITKIIENIDIPANPEAGLVFSDDFSSWEGTGLDIKPTGWTVYRKDDNNYLLNESSQLRMICLGFDALVLTVPQQLQINRTYRVKFDLVQGSVYLKTKYNKGRTCYYEGEVSVDIIMEQEYLQIVQYWSEDIIIDNFKVYEI